MNTRILKQKAYLNGTLHARICVFGGLGMFPCACGWGRGRELGIVPFHLSAYLGFAIPIPSALS